MEYALNDLVSLDKENPRLLRGGLFYDLPALVRSAIRLKVAPSSRLPNFGVSLRQDLSLTFVLLCVEKPPPRPTLPRSTRGGRFSLRKPGEDLSRSVSEYLSVLPHGPLASAGPWPFGFGPALGAHYPLSTRSSAVGATPNLQKIVGQTDQLPLG